VAQTGCFTGKGCAIVARSATPLMPGWGSIEQVIDATPYRGHRVRLRASARVETNSRFGGAELFMDTETTEIVPLATTMLGQSLRSPEWTRKELVIDVGENAAALRFGLAVTGDTKAWLDSVELSFDETARTKN
jgi:hypothetical protein